MATNLMQAQEDLAPAKRLIDEARELQIKEAKDIEQAGFTLTKLKEAKAMIDDYRKSMTEPLNKSLKSINTFFKQFSEPLELVDREIRARVQQFKLEFDASPPDEPKDFAERGLILKNRVSGVKLKKVWKYEVTDKSKVPLELMVVDGVAVNKLIRDGVRDVPGIRIFQEEIVSL